MRLLIPAALVLALAACDPKPAPAPGPAPAGAPAALDQALGEMTGFVRFCSIEYAAAVRDGQIVDRQEWDEAVEMGLKPAERAWKRLEPRLRGIDPAAADEVNARMAGLRKLVDAKADPVEVGTVSASIAEALLAHIAGGVPPQLLGTIAALTAADADCKGEIVSGGYRIGLATYAPRAIGSYDPAGAWTAWPKDGATHLLAVTVREQGTKRALGATKVTATFGGRAIELRPVWGEYLFYGANVALPEGDFKLAVDIQPPRMCRHADAMAMHLESARAEFPVSRRGAEVTVNASKPAPHNADYRIGQDVEQALAESLVRMEAGEYVLGFIAEGPEPIWCWEGDTLKGLEPGDGDTHHLEIALMERGSHRMVMGATVVLEMKNRTTGLVRRIPMHDLLSEFSHYGNTVKLEPGGWAVTVHVAPPAFGQFGEGRFRAPVSAAIEWDGKVAGE
ncbi:MAG: hypothetical protein HUU15_04915 [Candidatus Brocadiae bacterium]|nr:hypothetical protein [Candidatus Brocadiia bacterium]